ncbi:MAG: SDR family oxidoreductase [Bacillota bacterium]|nr:SDR family oxidoreductase [Bacillota bacterium]
MNNAKTAVVTGATAGIGLSAAKMLVKAGINVIGVGRDPDRCRAAKEAIIAETNNTNIRYITGDLSSILEVTRIASEIKTLLAENGGKLDILMNVAGTVSSWFVGTPDGYELQFAVNHLAPFLLTHELLPCLLSASAARVLVVSSGSHYHTRISWKDVMMRRHYSCLAAYKQSKLCNVLFITELARRLKDTPVCTYAIDPGLADTDIGLKGTTDIERFVWKLRQHSGTPPEIPAKYMVNVATKPEYAGKTGLYWQNGKEKKPSSVSRDQKQGEILWKLSEKLCGIKDKCPI